MPAPKSWLILALSGATVLGVGGLHLVRAIRSRTRESGSSDPDESPAGPIPADDLSSYLKAVSGQPRPTQEPDSSAGSIDLDLPSDLSQEAASETWHTPDDVPPLHAFLTDSTLGGMAQVIPTEAEEDEPVFVPFSPRPREDDISDWYLPLDRARLGEGMAYPGDFSLAKDPELHWIGGKLWALAADRLPASEEDEVTLTSSRQTYTLRRLEAEEGDTYIHLRRQPKA